MKNSTRIHIVIATLLLTASVGEVRGQCAAPTTSDLTNRLVIDARPNAINKFDGRTKFKKEAQIVVTNMNPFLYTYEIQVQQTEIKDTALFDIFQFLGSPLSDLLGIASVDRNRNRAAEPPPPVDDIGDLQQLIHLTETKNVPNQSCPGANEAISHMITLRQNILKRMVEIDKSFKAFGARYVGARAIYKPQIGVLFSPETDTETLCTSANELRTGLSGSKFPASSELEIFTNEDEVRIDASALADTSTVSLPTFDSLVKELKARAKFYANDPAYEDCKFKNKGFNFADSLQRLANTLDHRSRNYAAAADQMVKETQKYEFVQKAINKLDTPEGKRLLWKKIDFRGQYDVSAFDVSVTPVVVERREISATEVAADPFRSSERGAATLASTAVSLPFTNRLVPARRADGGEGEGSGDQKGGSSTNKTVASGTIGNRRFELSGGLVYSPLGRVEYQPVLGFARDEEGNLIDAEGKPTTERKLTPIVGVSEDSERRISPMIMLNTRLTNFRNNNLFFSLGFTGKKDSGGIDLEFLAGPSINFFNNNLFFTAGAYAGRQQRLAGDLFLNARLPEGAEKIPVRKEYEWKPGFSFTYRFPLKSRTEEPK
jgi:hypothetical protein